MPLPSPPPPPHPSTGSAIASSAPPRRTSNPPQNLYPHAATTATLPSPSRSPLPATPPLPTAAATDTASPLPRSSTTITSRRRPSRHVKWNERVEAHVAISVHDEEGEEQDDDHALDTDSTGTGEHDQDEVERERVRAVKAQGRRRKSSTTGTLFAAALGGGKNGEQTADDELERVTEEEDDPFSSRYRVDDVPISLDEGRGTENGALEGLVSPFANQLEVWVDPLERDGLPSALPPPPTVVGGEGADEGDEEKDRAANEEAARQEAEQKAVGLVQASTGGFGLWEGLRKRRNSIRQLGDREGDEKDLVDKVEQNILAEQHAAVLPGGAGGEGFQASAGGLAGVGGPGILAALMALQQEEAALAAHSQSNTPLSSTAPTPSTSTPNSPHLTPPGLIHPFEDGYFTADDSDDALERERFLERRRKKRASKNAFHTASNQAAQASKSAAKAAFRVATGGAFRHHSASHGHGEREREKDRGRPFSASSRSASTSTLPSVGEEGDRSRSRSRSRSRNHSQASSPTTSSAFPSPAVRPASIASSVSLLSPTTTSPTFPTGFPPHHPTSRSPTGEFSKAHRSHSHNTLSRLLSRSSLSPPVSPTSPTSPTSPAQLGVFVPHKAKVSSDLAKRVRKLGDRLGLELESERTRPAAARSAAGVFGGLVFGTAALAAPATPSASALAPLPTRPGYHLSRYSAPDVKASATTGRSTSPTSPTSESKPPSPLPHASPHRTLSPPPPPALSRPGSTDGFSPPPPRSPAQRSFDSSARAANSSRKSLNEMVREEEEQMERQQQQEEKEEEEERRLGQSSGAGSAVIPSSLVRSRAGTPPAPPTPGLSAGAGPFKGRRKKAVFSLQLNDLPTPVVDDYQESRASSRRPSLTISTAGLTPGSAPTVDRSQRSPRQRASPSPTSATFRFFNSGPFTPRSPDGAGGATSPIKEYFSLSPSTLGAALEKEKDRMARKMREEEEREARERERDLREWHKEKKRRRKQREKELKARRVFITAHVAAIIERQQFILKLARAFMMFGAPSHRLEAQIQATARVLELPHCAAMYLPNCMLINFADPATCTSDIKFLKQPGGLDFGKLKTTYFIYNKVIRDKIAVTDASARLDALMTSPNKYKLWQHVVLGGLAGAFIAPSAFYASFIDCLMTIPLGGMLVLVQVFLARNDMYSSLFEIVVCTINAIFAGLLSYTNYFCFYSVAASSIVLVLPGFIVLCAALEIANRSIVSGAVRITYAALYALFLGFGLSAGSEIYTMGGRHELAGGGDYTCTYIRQDAPWYRSTIPPWWYFLTIPGFLFCMAIKHGQPVFRRDTFAMIAIGCCGFSTNYLSGLYVFINQPAVTSMIGAFVVGVLGNAWARATRESAFVVMIVGLFVQLPSGLANGGLISFAQNSTRRDGNNFGTAIAAAGGLIRVTVGITVGLFAAAALMNIVSRRGRRRGANLSTF
ncbi:hypothetical protein JCM11251_006873 [Rhodosporidiobolus azoricus]